MLHVDYWKHIQSGRDNSVLDRSMNMLYFGTIQIVVVAQILVWPFYNLANKSEYKREIRIRFKKGMKNQRDLNKKKNREIRRRFKIEMKK